MILTIDNAAKHIEFLTKQCPHRHPGDADERKAADYITKQLESMGLNPRTVATEIQGWRVNSGPELVVIETGESIECAPFIFSQTTPPEGSMGRPRYTGKRKIIGFFDWDNYQVTNGPLQFSVVVRPNGPPIAQPWTFPDRTPACVIAAKDLTRIQKKRVAYRCTTSEPHVSMHEVEAFVEGTDKRNETLLICTHLDSMGATGFPLQIDSPGTTDNASGCAAVLELARAFATTRPTRSVLLYFTSGEEWNLQGSGRLVNRLSAESKLQRITAMVNADALSWRGAEDIWVNANSETPLDMRRLVEETARQANIKRKLVFFTPPTPGQDHWPFHAAGLPACTIFTHNDTYYHTQDDNLNNMDPAVYQDSARLLFSLVERLVYQP